MILPTNRRCLRSVLFQWAVAVVLFLGAFDLAADVKVSRPMVRTGFSPRIQRQNWAVFQCYIENNDAAKRTVLIRLKTEEGMDQTNYFAAEFEIAPRSVATVRFPVILDASENTDLDVYADGVMVPKSNATLTVSKFLAPKDSQVGVFGDSDDTLGAFVQLPAFRQNLFSTMIPYQFLPNHWQPYKALDALILFKPDFSAYSELAFQAIIEYVANGGQLIVAGPETAFAMAKTPLNILLPVIPTGQHLVQDAAQLRKIAASHTGFKLDAFSGDGVPFLESVPRERGVSILEYDSMPLLRVMNFGFGTVKLCAIAPHDKYFLNTDALQQYFQFLFAAQPLIPNHQAFAETLDNLTGFRIPDVSVVRGKLFFYLFLVFAVIVAGMFFRRYAAWSWLAVGFIALIATMQILNEAKSAFGERGSIFAELQVRNDLPSPSAHAYSSFFAIEELNLTAEANDKGGVFSAILPSPKLGLFSAAAPLPDNIPGMEDTSIMSSRKTSALPRNLTPIRLRLSSSHVHRIDDLNIAPRTSKQFMYLQDAAGTPSNAVPAYPRPKLNLTENGLVLEPYVIPEDLSDGLESVALILPGGAIPAVKNANGSYSLENKGGLFVDSMLESILDALVEGERKGTPALALIRPLRENLARVHGVEFTPQGKQITLLPVQLAIVDRKVKIPAEMMLFSPSDSASRMMFRGNKISSSINLIVDQSIQPRFTLPQNLIGIFTPETARVTVAFSHGGNVRLDVAMKPEGKAASLPGIKDRDAWNFSGAVVPGMISPVSGSAVLVIEPKPLSSLNPDDEQYMRVSSWSISDLGIELEGTIDESIALPANF